MFARDKMTVPVQATRASMLLIPVPLIVVHWWVAIRRSEQSV